MRSAPVPRPSFTPSLIFTERESEVVGVRPTATGTSPCLITDTHTVWAARAHSESDALPLSLSLSLVTMATARMAEKGEMRRRGCGGGVAMATALA